MTHMTAAQAAQQSNRDGGGRYTTKVRSEPDVNLSSASSGQSVADVEKHLGFEVPQPLDLTLPQRSQDYHDADDWNSEVRLLHAHLRRMQNEGLTATEAVENYVADPAAAGTLFTDVLRSHVRRRTAQVRPGTAVRMAVAGGEQTYVNGRLQSVNDEPSQRDRDGTLTWHRRGALHRESGPALAERSGSMAWFVNGVNKNPKLGGPNRVDRMRNGDLIARYPGDIEHPISPKWQVWNRPPRLNYHKEIERLGEGFLKELGPHDRW